MRPSEDAAARIAGYDVPRTPQRVEAMESRSAVIAAETSLHTTAPFEPSGSSRDALVSGPINDDSLFSTHRHDDSSETSISTHQQALAELILARISTDEDPLRHSRWLKLTRCSRFEPVKKNRTRRFFHAIGRNVCESLMVKYPARWEKDLKCPDSALMRRLNAREEEIMIRSDWDAEQRAASCGRRGRREEETGVDAGPFMSGAL
jgi:hypothetical protein